MGYIDQELGIKSVKGIEKHVKQHFANQGITVSMECMKNPNGVKTFWAIDNYLHTHVMPDSFVLYAIKKESLDGLIEAIEASLQQRV